mmetsp:Transcript_26610/g.40601  ORF Transcript_26610/g.40601 Transcript_26610/m.40601 type:complete len:194 (+) Transcript_26610:541-1122(+)
MTYFLILFGIFLLTLAESFSLVDVDVSAYGRIPRIGAYAMAVLRCAMGDFSILDPYQGFDLYSYETDENGEEEKVFRYSLVVISFTFLFFLITIFFMFMIFMNFIIAVISESYSKVIQNKEAFDYQQRAAMIYEREVHFRQRHFDDEFYFPTILIVRKMKQNNFNGKNGKQSYIGMVKTYIRNIGHKISDLVS